MNKIVFCLYLLLAINLHLGLHGKIPNWRIPKQSLPSHDIPVIGYDVFEFGAKGDGISDDTAAFQKGINRLHELGGGTLWVPAGHYAFKENLLLKPNVVLRGEWADPYQNDYKVQGTVLKVFTDRGNEGGKPFIEMLPVTAIQYINFWYPEQGIAGKLTPYPVTIKNKIGFNLNCKVTVENVTFVNSWRAIQMGPRGNTLWTIRSVNGFPLRTGIETDGTLDVGRLHKINFAPEFWCQSGLDLSPSLVSSIMKSVYNEGTGILIRKHDFVSYAAFRLRGYKFGLAGDFLTPNAKVENRMKQFGDRFFQGHFYDIDIEQCRFAVRIRAMLACGVFFSGSRLSGDETGILIEEENLNPIGLTECTISGGGHSIKDTGGSILSVTACNLNGLLKKSSGVLSVLDSKVKGDGSYDLELGKSVRKVKISSVNSGSELRMNSEMPPEKISIIKEIGEPIKRLDPMYEHITSYAIEGLMPKSRNLIVYDGHSGPATITRDHFEKTQKNLYELEEKGGGILFFPPGYYSFYSSLRIPSGVELRGAIDTPLHAARAGTTFNILTPEGEPMDEAFISMNSRSGLKGICFNYPNQNYENFRSYPFAIRGQGEKIYIQNVTATGVMHYLDLASHRCDGHFVDYLSGCALKTGIYVGGQSRGGRIYNTQLIAHYWWLFDSVYPSGDSNYWVSCKGKFPVPDWFEKRAPDKKGSQKILFDCLTKELNAFIIGDVQDQILFHNFSYGHYRGLYAINQGNGGPDVQILLHGSDRSTIAADFDFLSPKNQVSMVAFMSYGLDRENGINFRMGKNARGYIKLLDSELGGHHRQSLDIRNGHFYANGLTVSLLENGISLGDQAKITMNNVTYLYKSKYKNPNDLIRENTTIRNFYYKPNRNFVNF